MQDGYGRTSPRTIGETMGSLSSEIRRLNELFKKAGTTHSKPTTTSRTSQPTSIVEGPVPHYLASVHFTPTPGMTPGMTTTSVTTSVRDAEMMEQFHLDPAPVIEVAFNPKCAQCQLERASPHDNGHGGGLQVGSAHSCFTTVSSMGATTRAEEGSAAHEQAIPTLR
eukprot:NODE_11080_length_565_cov_1.766968_g10799_i0.p2 GENE.NODE_11080_length_565_cov_1.766968_g10799_i0~~NODE_11080_length_565_cov_1.766968_g10799_i0.p2  ORF type:complete len:167 (-),score=29.69 NODE_11080_length_565_cov_1.766968_g10799_i0:5-505(-)